MMTREDWTPVATTLGFTSEKELLLHLYEEMSIEDIAARIGYSRGVVRRRLMEYGAVMRSRGGSNYKGFKRVAEATDEMLSNPVQAAKLLNVHLSTIHKERRRRMLCSSPQSAPATTSDSLKTDETTSSSDSSVEPTPSTLSSIEDELRQVTTSSSTTESTREPECTSETTET